MIVIFFGPPGAGKGTQASRISEVLEVPQIATGDIFRGKSKENSQLGRKVKGFMEKGQLIPDEIVNEVVRERISKRDCKKGFILDGYPRTIDQAIYLDKALKDMGKEITAVIYLEVNEDEIVKRLSYRRTCNKCGAIYHLIFNPPRVSKVCDRCGGKLYQRKDDREEVIRERIGVYKEKTEPLLRFYHERGKLFKVNGNREIDDVAKEIMDILETVKKGDV